MPLRFDGLPQLLYGETVTVRTKTLDYDAHMDKVETWESEVVDNVLVAPGSTSDVYDSARPDGTRVSFTLGFPKTYSESLRGRRVVVRGIECAVIGDPQPATRENTPTQWWYTAEVEAVDG